MTVSKKRSNPYKGPRAFRQSEYLHGRNTDTRVVLNTLVAQKILLLHARSGIGKSSLIQAALIPGLKELGFFVLPTVRMRKASLQTDDKADPGDHEIFANPLLSSLVLSLNELSWKKSPQHEPTPPSPPRPVGREKL